MELRISSRMPSPRNSTVYNSEEHFPQVGQLKKTGTVYLDSAATSLKHRSALEAQFDFDSTSVANVHRGSYKLSSEATDKYELSRSKVASYLNCRPEQIVFTKGTTDAVNIVANSFALKLNAQDSILITEMEHHANLIPWQEVSKKSGAKLLYCSVNSKGELDLEEISNLLSKNNVKIMSLCHMSNTLGTLNPLAEIQKICALNSTELFIDGAQAVSAMRPDMAKLEADFYAFSTHKIFGPFGVGILYVKKIDLLHFNQVGGGIIDVVDFQTSTFLKGPQKMEPGTPHISGIVSLSPLIDFLLSLDFEAVRFHEKNLLEKATRKLSLIEGFEPVGTSSSKINILSFNFEGVHPNDLCALLDEQGLALRSGHHCTQPLLKKMGLSGCARASFSIYNTEQDVDLLVQATHKALEMLR